MSVRHAQKSDYKSVKELLRKEDMIIPKRFTKERFTKAITVNKRYSFVEERDGKVVGFITGFDDGGAFFGYLGRLVVDPDYRRLGIGEKLVKLCLSEFKRNGVPTIFFGIHKDNRTPERLVKKFGAEDGGYRLMYFRP